jgi:hypothetical protein
MTLTSSMIGRSGRKICQLIMVNSGNTVVQKSSQFEAYVGRANEIERSVDDGVTIIILSEAVTEMAREAAAAAAEEAVADVVEDCQAIADAASASADAAAQSASDAQTAAASITVDATLDPTSTHAIQNKAVASEISSIKADLGNLTPGLSQDARAALLACIEHVWWTDGHGREYYNSLQVALYPDTGLVSITAVFTQGSAVIYQTTPLNDLKAYLVVTGHYNNGTTKVITDYSLSGTLTVGTSTLTVNVNGKTTTFTVTVSAPYWDYEWYATSGTLPEGMTANAYDFSTVPGALHVEKPVMDFDYIGDIRLYIECSLYAVNAETGGEFRLSNPQIVIKNKVVSENQFKGCKVIASPSQTSTFYVGFGVNGTTAIIPEIASMDIHAYDISAINGVYSLTIDGTEISITQNDNTTQYINFTGITSADGVQSLQIMNIKCIKYKKL